MGFMCSAVWDRNGDYASAIAVTNYANTTTLSDNTMPWNREGSEDAEVWWMAYEKTDEDVDYTSEYRSEYSSKNPKMSLQACGAYAPTYGVNADGTPNELYGNDYWDLKNTGSVTFDTGYRIYASASEDKPYSYASGGSTTYTLADHGYVNPNPVVVEPDDDEMGDDSTSGAAALFTATATVLATFLMF